ncbi:non-specific lipid transfer protein GPI-anchored 8-like [Vicia villosa]|uniref:non-specific lipid transfer protein GPI-anchored 8-like n=1 Tax=Vicia villosa TaxID=3911 RepID=UPI00273B7C2A|nr:non-specific lipid transfer protein GPI-anchored 8-like [Vicia villosa]
MMYIITSLMIISMSVISLVDAQELPPCANPLLPCIHYANSNTPPDNICCNPIKDVNTTYETCFCQIALTPGLLEAYGLKLAQAFKILHSCGVKMDPSICNAPSPILPLTLMQPSATPKSDEGGANKISLTRLCFIVFIWTLLLFK